MIKRSRYYPLSSPEQVLSKASNRVSVRSEASACIWALQFLSRQRPYPLLQLGFGFWIPSLLAFNDGFDYCPCVISHRISNPEPCKSQKHPKPLSPTAYQTCLTKIKVQIFLRVLKTLTSRGAIIDFPLRSNRIISQSNMLSFVERSGTAVPFATTAYNLSNTVCITEMLYINYI